MAFFFRPTAARAAYRGGFNYNRFQQTSNLFQRWARRPTFYYEVGGIAAACGGFWVYNLEVVPVSGRRRFNIVSPATERALGLQAYEQIVEEYRGRILSPSHPQHRMVERVLDRLLPHADVDANDASSWRVHVIRDDTKNAFVIPGGRVFVFSGILDVCGSEDGLAAVLGHEIAHNIAHHQAEKMSLQNLRMLPVLAMSLFVGDIGGMLSSWAIEFGFSLPGSRRQESEADYIGLLMMARACYDPAAAVALWQAMSKQAEDEPPQFLSTHPANASRIEQIRKWLPEAEAKREENGCGELSRALDGFRLLPRSW